MKFAINCLYSALVAGYSRLKPGCFYKGWGFFPMKAEKYRRGNLPHPDGIATDSIGDLTGSHRGNVVFIWKNLLG